MPVLLLLAGQLTAQVPFSLPPNTSGVPVTAAEYFFDADPGFGMGTSIPVIPSTDYTSTFSISLTGLSGGAHTLFTRAKDNLGRWGVTSSKLFFIGTAHIPANGSTASIVRAEYFVDTDPGFGNGHPVIVSPGDSITVSNIAVDISGLNNGLHHLYVRSQDSKGRWSITQLQHLTIFAMQLPIIPATAAPDLISRLEYFIDTDPGFGNGTMVSIPPAAAISDFVFAADVSALPQGSHTLYVRTVDKWSLSATKSFVVGPGALPVSWVSVDAAKKERGVALRWKTANEHGGEVYTVERSANGQEFVKIGETGADQAAAAVHSYHFFDGQPFAGISYYRIRQTDASGQLTFSPVVTIRVQPAAGSYTINNPVQDVLSIHASADATFVITDVSGNQVLQFNMNGLTDRQIDVSTLVPGMYLLKDRSSDERGIKRFVKQ